MRISNLLLACAFIFAPFHVVWSSTPPIPVASDCDTMVLSNGKLILVKNLDWNQNELRFSYCDDSENKPLTAPWQQIKYVAKAGGSRFEAPSRSPETLPFTQDQTCVEQEVKNLQILAILSFPALLLFGAGIVTAIIVWVKARRLKRLIIGHPNEARLRKKIRSSLLIVKILLGLLFILGLIGTVTFIAVFGGYNGP